MMTPIQNLLTWITPLNATLAVTTCVIVYISSQIIYYHFFHPLAVFPGPFWGGVTRLWLAYQNYNATELETQLELHKKYGSVLRITPTTLVVSDSLQLPVIYHRFANKSNYYVTGGFGVTESVFNMKEHKMHAKFRKMIAGPYSFSSIKKLEYLIDARAEHWLSRITEKFADTGDTFDFAPWAVYMTYDVISEIGFGAPVGFVDAGHDINGLIKSFHQGMKIFAILSRLHPFMTFIKKTWIGQKYFVAKPEDNSGIGILMQLRDKLLTQRLVDIEQGKTAGRVDLLQTFLDARTEEGEPLDVEYIRAEILLVLLAGADTTGTAFQGFVYHVLRYPKIYKRLMEELDDVTRKGLLSPMPVFEEVAGNCPYYIACLRETLRLWPSSPAMLPRVVSEPGVEFNGKFVPPGMEVTCNPWLVQRDPEMYGEDAEEFKPERWLDPEKAKQYMKYSFVFGYGSRVCLGKDVALMELYKGPLQFFRRFNVHPINKEKPGAWEFVGGVGYWKNMHMTISERAPVKSIK